MPVALGRRNVEAPPFAPARYGLWSVVDQPIDGDAHWQAGVQFQPNPCGEGNVVLDNCPGIEDVIKTPTADGLETVGADPFTVYAWIDCSVTGFVEMAELRSVAALTNGEARALERAFWTGVAQNGTVNPHLAADAEVVDMASITPVTVQTAATVITGTYGVFGAVGQLEGALSECYGGEGVIHIPSSALAELDAAGAVQRDGERLRTRYGNRIAVYSSNNLQGPDGTVPATGGWFYATGAITGRRSDAKPTSTIRQAVNRAKNSMVLLVERTYVLGWDCCHFAVHASFGNPI
jgi:hypothetical protein